MDLRRSRRLVSSLPAPLRRPAQHPLLIQPYDLFHQLVIYALELLDFADVGCLALIPEGLLLLDVFVEGQELDFDVVAEVGEICLHRFLVLIGLFY